MIPGRPRHALAGLLALVMWACGAAAASGAPSSVSYPADTVIVAGNPGAFSIEVSKFTTFSCSGGFPPSCTFAPDYDIASPQGFTNNTAARCVDTSGATPPTALDCSPIPARTAITGSPEGDTVSATCDFLGASARVDVVAGGGADTLTLGCGADVVDGGPGDDTISAGSGADTVAAGDGDDAVQAGADADTVTGGPGADTIAGGAGDDGLAGELGNDVISGAAGDDTLDGGDGADTLVGGDGRDLLIPGAGADAIAGGSSIDTVSYEDRTDGVPLRIALDGAGGDGAPGEEDVIAADVENVIGSPGADTIIGDAGANDLDGGASNDTIVPGPGPDFVDAGSGDDRIEARDGAQDRIECGEGVDAAVIDEFDAVSNCEAVDASRELMPDVDNDGVPAPVDCDDRNPTVRPGLPDRPGNGIDEDCAGGDAPFARIVTPVQNTFKVFRSFTRVARLRVLDLPAGARVELRCKGAKRGCFGGVKRMRAPKGAAVKDLMRFVRGRKLEPKARLEVRVLRTDSIGKVVRFTVRRGKAPATALRCLPPGERRPERC